MKAISATIAIDAMGGDYAPSVVVQGAVAGVNEDGISVILIGREDEIRKELKVFHGEEVSGKLEIIHSQDVIAMNDLPTQILRKKESSLGMAIKLVKEGKAGSIFSAGNSGALVAGANRILQVIDKVEKPGILIAFPTISGKDIYIIDAGASTDHRPRDILVSARMGKVYAEEIAGIQNPRIGLINIGSEAFKGNETVRAAYKLLSNAGMNFVGNVEGNAIADGRADVVVCDGFIGNTVLKIAEGTVGFVTTVLKREIMRDFRGKIGGLLLKPAFQRLKKRVDWKEFGGGVILGFKGNVLIAHGRSDATAVRNGLRLAGKLGSADLWQKIEKDLISIEV